MCYIFLRPVNLIVYLVNVAHCNLASLKTYKNKFVDIIILFTDQNGKLLEIENKVIMTLLTRCSLEPRRRKCVKEYRFL